MKGKIKKIIVVSSTYPSHDKEKVPSFVKKQLNAFYNIDKSLKLAVLAPHNKTSHKFIFPRKKENITEYRFHYFLKRFETLTDRGIMPALSQNKINYLLIPFLMVGEFFALLNLTIRNKPDLIYAHWFTPQAINASIVSKLTKTPYVFTTHASDVDVWRRFGVLGKYLVRYFTSNAKAITAVSNQTHKKLSSFFNSSPEISIIPMGIDLHKKIEPGNKNEILFIGRLTEKKGLQYLLPAFAKVLVNYPKIHLTIAGDGELRKTLEALVKNLEIDKSVTFRGFVTGNEKDKLLKKAGILVVPSIITKSGDSEGLPVSLMEGLAYGKITLSTSVSGSEDVIVNGTNGYIVKPENSDEIAESLEKYLNTSEKKLDEIRKNSFNKSRELAWPIIARKHLDLFNQKFNN